MEQAQAFQGLAGVCADEIGHKPCGYGPVGVALGVRRFEEVGLSAHWYGVGHQVIDGGRLVSVVRRVDGLGE